MSRLRPHHADILRPRRAGRPRPRARDRPAHRPDGRRGGQLSARSAHAPAGAVRSGTADVGARPGRCRRHRRRLPRLRRPLRGLRRRDHGTDRPSAAGRHPFEHRRPGPGGGPALRHSGGGAVLAQLGRRAARERAGGNRRRGNDRAAGIRLCRRRRLPDAGTVDADDAGGQPARHRTDRPARPRPERRDPGRAGARRRPAAGAGVLGRLGDGGRRRLSLGPTGRDRLDQGPRTAPRRRDRLHRPARVLRDRHRQARLRHVRGSDRQPDPTGARRTAGLVGNARARRLGPAARVRDGNRQGDAAGRGRADDPRPDGRDAARPAGADRRGRSGGRPARLCPGGGKPLPRLSRPGGQSPQDGVWIGRPSKARRRSHRDGR